MNHPSQASNLRLFHFVPDPRPEMRLAFIGCMAPDSRTADCLTDSAWSALCALQAEILTRLLGGPDPAPRTVGAAAEAVSAAMIRTYGTGANWWTLPAEAHRTWRSPSGLDVPTWWGLGVAAGQFNRLSITQKGKGRRTAIAAIRAAGNLAHLMEDWCGYWRPGRYREWSTAAQHSTGWARYVRAEAAAGGLHLLVQTIASELAAPVPIRQAFVPRLVDN